MTDLLERPAETSPLTDPADEETRTGRWKWVVAGIAVILVPIMVFAAYTMFLMSMLGSGGGTASSCSVSAVGVGT